MKKIQIGGHRNKSLVRGYALVDDEDYEWLNQYKWSMSIGRKSNYAFRYVRENGKQKAIRMHRLILSTPNGLCTDHIDGDGLNNQRSNLRVATHSQNQQNQRIQKNRSSQFKGVNWNKHHKVWMATIRIDGKKIYLGSFKKEGDAARAYDKKASEHFGEFALLNLKRN